MDIADVKNAAIAKATTPNEDGKDRPAMADVKDTLDQFKRLPEKDREDLRKAYAQEF